jgi:hypothetical protein
MMVLSSLDAIIINNSIYTPDPDPTAQEEAWHLLQVIP